MTSPYISAIEAKGWSLYDMGTEELQTEGWETRATLRRPVIAVEEGGMYGFMPQPFDGQSLEDAYESTSGLGPCLRISRATSPEYKEISLRFSPRLAIFSRFVLHDAEVTLFTPTTLELPDPDFVTLRAQDAQAVFERDFDVLTPRALRQELNYVKAEWRV